MRWRILSAFIAGVFIFAGLVLTIMTDEIANSVKRERGWEIDRSGTALHSN
jgi:hypothetical protein